MKTSLLLSQFLTILNSKLWLNSNYRSDCDGFPDSFPFYLDFRKGYSPSYPLWYPELLVVHYINF